MATDVVMPKLSDTMEEGRIIKWLKQVGDHVKEGEPLLEVETDKADIEVEAFDTGSLLEILVDEGETVKVGEKIAVIGAEEEAKPAEKRPEREEEEEAEEEAEPVEEVEEEEKEEEEKEEEEKKEAPAERKKEEERAKKEEEKKRAQKEEEQKRKKEEEEEREKKKKEEGKKKEEEEKKGEVPQKKAEKERKEEEQREREVKVHMEQREAIEKFVARRAPGKVKASPLARELAQQHDIDLSEVRGTGPGGEIVKRDIEEVIGGEAKAKPEVEEKPTKREIKATPLAAILAEKEDVDLEELKGTGIDGRIREQDVKAYIAKRCAMRGEEYQELSLMRKTIARRMTESMQTTPHFYLTMAIDMGAALELRKKLNEDRNDQEKISVNDMIVKAAAFALREVPEVNSTFSDEKIKVNKNVNIGVAVATPDGLVVPVIMDVDKKSVRDIAGDIREKAERARKRKLKPDEYSNATFTVSNLGMLGIEHFTAIIDPGQSGILAVGAVSKEPVVENDSIKIRQVMRVTLSCDHRVVDGYAGARFLVKLKEILEEPEKEIA